MLLLAVLIACVAIVEAGSTASRQRRRDLPHQPPDRAGRARLRGSCPCLHRPPGPSSTRPARAFWRTRTRPRRLPITSYPRWRRLDGLCRSQDVHVHATQRLSLQRRESRTRQCLRAGNRSDARAWYPLTRRPTRARDRRRDRSARGEEEDLCVRCRSSRSHARRPADAAAPDFLHRTTSTFFCAVPPTLPADPEGVRTFPAAGPYYVAEHSPGERVVLRRNPHYGGTRPHHVDGFVVDLRATSPTGGARPRRARRSRLGPHDVEHLLRARSESHREVRARLAVLRQAWIHAANARLQLGAAVVQGQHEVAQGSQFRARSSRHRQRCQWLGGERGQRSVPPREHARLHGRRRLPAPRART